MPLHPSQDLSLNSRSFTKATMAIPGTTLLLILSIV